MADIGVSRTGSVQADAPAKTTSGWAIGSTYFAAMMMMMIGLFHVIVGSSRSSTTSLRRDP